MKMGCSPLKQILMIFVHEFLKKWLFKNKDNDIKSIKIRIKMVALEFNNNGHIYTCWKKIILPLMHWHPVAFKCESDFSFKQFFYWCWIC